MFVRNDDDHNYDDNYINNNYNDTYNGNNNDDDENVSMIHYSDVLMSAMASRITGVSIVCLTVCSQIKENIKALATGFCEGIYR